MSILTQSEGVTLLVIFGVLMVALVVINGKPERNIDGFLVADRSIGLWQGAFSTAVSWVWAPAIFICSMQAFNFGVAGVLWFTLPNIFCFVLFAPIALKLRREMPLGYTLPQFLEHRFGRGSKVHLIFLVVFLGYQVSAMLINALAGGFLLHAVSGLDANIAIVGMTLIALTYSLIRGLKASIFTDVIQMSMLLLVAFVLVPACFLKGGGMENFLEGLGGLSGSYRSPFNAWIAFSLGIPMTLGLLSGPVGDQMFYQRALSINEKDMFKSFIYAGLIFGLVPITLSLLGFIGAGMVRNGTLEVLDPQLVGPVVIAATLPKAALYAFCFMAFAGLCSTMDSSLCAISSLGAIDIYRRYLKTNSTSLATLRFSRYFMIGLALAATGIALLQPKLLWVFLISGALVSSILFPTIYALFSKNISAKAIYYSVGLALMLGTPLSIYANLNENPVLIVVAALVPVLLGFLICAGWPRDSLRTGVCDT